MMKGFDKMIVWQKSKVSYTQRCEKLGQIGFVVWFTGLSGAGKSTIGVEVEKRLIEKGNIVYLLDGDNIRHGLNSDLGFSKEDRNENIRRIAEVAALFKDAGLIVLVSCISPYKSMRNFAKGKIGNDNFVEIYIKADIKTCEKRDPKGLYKKVERKEIKDFTGISSGYEVPENPDLVIDTDILSVEASVLKVLAFIRDRV